MFATGAGGSADRQSARLLRPRKRLGQHFLVDPNTARRIVDSLEADPQASVVEIGPGTGALTRLLLDRFEHVKAIEVDPRAVQHLRHELPGLDVLEADVLCVDWRAMVRSPIHVIGNLPYNITSPILFSLLEQEGLFAQAILMVQLEVARRWVAAPGSKAYGIPSVFVQLGADAKVLFRVSQNVFRPKPAVESAVVRLRFNRAIPTDIDRQLFGAVVRSAFGQRRKVLTNSLRRWKHVPLPSRWAQARAEELSPHDFVELTRHIQRSQTL